MLVIIVLKLFIYCIIICCFNIFLGFKDMIVVKVIKDKDNVILLV